MRVSLVLEPHVKQASDRLGVLFSCGTGWILVFLRVVAVLLVLAISSVTGGRAQGGRGGGLGSEGGQASGILYFLYAILGYCLGRVFKDKVS